MDNKIYYKAKRFFPDKTYEDFSGITAREEIVTFDSLCEVVNVEGINGTEYLCDWNYGVSDLKVLLSKPLKHDEQIIACFRNPTKNHEFHKLDVRFEFCGYDLSDNTMTSAITNSGGGFDKAIPYNTLNQYGLISNFNVAITCRYLLEQLYGEIIVGDPHAYCDIFEIWRTLKL
ncbi:MAG: hypothetical protein FWC95_04270 [Defluviitaleaceae bacterium]|nr:hypothetical protein [Defluviitaleaceae bacterium]